MRKVADADAGGGGEGLAVLRAHGAHRTAHADAPGPPAVPRPGPRGHRKVPTGGAGARANR